MKHIFLAQGAVSYFFFLVRLNTEIKKIKIRDCLKKTFSLRIFLRGFVFKEKEYILLIFLSKTGEEKFLNTKYSERHENCRFNSYFWILQLKLAYGTHVWYDQIRLPFQISFELPLFSYWFHKDLEKVHSELQKLKNYTRNKAVSIRKVYSNVPTSGYLKL